MRKFLNIFYIFFPLLIGIIIGILINKNIDYSMLNMPPLSPPKILFPIVWSILYILMGISYFLYKNNYNESKRINIVYYLQLFVNALWSIIFFLWKLRLLAVIWIILLLILVIYLILLFYNNTKISAYLNIPYLIWLLFATYLSIGVFILN